MLYLSNIKVPGIFEPTRLSGVVNCIAAEDFPASQSTIRDLHEEGSCLLRMDIEWPSELWPLDLGESTLPLADLPIGAELVSFSRVGATELIGTYCGRRLGWQWRQGIDIPGPLTWRLRPPFPVTTIPRGLRVSYGGIEYAADLGPERNWVTLFPESAREESFRVPLDTCDNIFCVYVRAWWNDMLFDAIDSREEGVTLVYLDGDRDVAEQLGFIEVDSKSWRINVSHAQISGITREVINLTGHGRDALYERG